MSATRPSRPLEGSPARERVAAPTRAETATPAPRDVSMLRARRREASRRRRLLRVDVGLGVLAALVLLLATPGLAIAAICAGLLLAACGISLALQRRRARRQIAASASRRGGAGEGRPSG